MKYTIFRPLDKYCLTHLGIKKYLTDKMTNDSVQRLKNVEVVKKIL